MRWVGVHRAPGSGLFGVGTAGRATTVNGDDCASDEAGGVGEQVGDGVGDLLGSADPAERVQRRHLLLRAGRGLRPLLGDMGVVPLGTD